MYFSYSVSTDVGRKKDLNEDYVMDFNPVEDYDLQHSGRLFIVADGSESALYGERVSRYVSERVVSDYYELSEILPGERLQKIIQSAGNKINVFAKEGMATTIVVAAILDDNLVIANVGNSRAYLIRDGILGIILFFPRWYVKG